MFYRSAKSLFSLKWVALSLTTLVTGIIVFLIYSRWEEIVAFPWKLHGGYLILVLVLHSAALFVTFLVWHLMVVGLGGFNKSGVNFRLYYISSLAKRIPTSIPYIGSRLVMYKNAGVSGSIIVNCILFENILITIAGILTFIVFLPFYTNIPKGITLPLVLIWLILIGLILLKPQLFIEITNWGLRKLNKQTLDKAPSRRHLLLWIGLYILPWLLAGGSFHFAPRALTENVHLGYIDALEISTLATLISLLSLVLPGGLSLKELTASTLLTEWMPFSTALVVALAYRLLHTVNEIVWAAGALYFFRDPPLDIPSNGEASLEKTP